MPSTIVPQPPPARADGPGRASQQPVRLSTLRPGVRARMHESQLAPSEHALLRALGLTERSVLHVRKAGEPCIVEVRATRIGLSRTIASGILVVPEQRA